MKFGCPRRCRMEASPTSCIDEDSQISLSFSPRRRSVRNSCNVCWFILQNPLQTGIFVHFFEELFNQFTNDFLIFNNDYENAELRFR